MIHPLPEGAEAALRTALALALLAVMPAWTFGLVEALAPGMETALLQGLAIGLAVALALLAGRDGARPEGALPDPGGPAGAAPPTRAAGWWRLAAALLGLAALVALAAALPAWQLRLARPDASMLALAAPALAGVVIATWWRLGAVLPVVLGALALFVLLIGPVLPDRFATRAVDGARVLSYLAYDSNGLFSRLVTIAVATIAPFVLLGGLLAATGLGQALTEPLRRALRGTQGGAPKAAVLGSAGFGLVSGSAVANVATSGPITIPMMLRAGTPRHQAAAVEAVASSAGQLMPPIMGASAFLMAEWLGVPYAQVALAALVPGLLIFAALLLAVDLDARALGPAGAVPADKPDRPAQGADVPRFQRVATAARLLVPLGVLVWLLFGAGTPPGKAALLACAILAALYLVLPDPHGTVAAKAATLLRGARDSAPAIAGIVLLAATASLVMGLLSLSGLGFMLTLRLVDLAGGSFLALALATAGLSLVMGLGMPTVGVYVITASLCAPALIAAGATPMAAHLFVLCMGMLSMITPPVALASYAAATLAGAPPWPTAMAALRLGTPLALVAAAVLAQPALLTPLEDPAFWWAFGPCAMALALVTAAQAGQAGVRLGIPARLAALLLAGANFAAMAAGVASAGWLAAFLGGAALFALHARAGTPGLAGIGAAGCGTKRKT